MVQIAGYYDETAKPTSGFDPIPAGVYVAEIVESDIEPISKTNDYGNTLKLTWKIAEGEYAGRLIWQRLNMWGQGYNKAEEVKRGANEDFALIRHITGVLNVNDTSELHFIPMQIKVKVKVDPNGQREPQNEISRGGIYALSNVTAFAGAMNAGATSAPPARPASPPPGAPKAASAAGTFSFRR
jgi:hypothetical protein